MWPELSPVYFLGVAKLPRRDLDTGQSNGPFSNGPLAGQRSSLCQPTNPPGLIFERRGGPLAAGGSPSAFNLQLGGILVMD